MILSTLSLSQLAAYRTRLILMMFPAGNVPCSWWVRAIEVDVTVVIRLRSVTDPQIGRSRIVVGHGKHHRFRRRRFAEYIHGMVTAHRNEKPLLAKRPRSKMAGRAPIPLYAVWMLLTGTLPLRSSAVSKETF